MDKVVLRETERLVLSIPEAAARVSLSPWTIRKWITQGKLTATRLGRRVCIRPEALQDLVDRGTVKPTAAVRKKRKR